MLILEFVKNVNKEFNILHIFNAKTFADGIDLDLELLLRTGIHASLNCFIVDKIGGLCDKEPKDLLHTFILLPSRILIFGANTLVIDQLRFGLGLGIVTALGVHDRGVLVHERVALSGRVSPLVARVSGHGVRFRQESEELVSGWLPLDRELLEMDDFVSMHDLLDEVTSFLVVHWPNLLDAFVISFLESLETFLQLDELVGEQLIVFSVLGVQVFGISLLNSEGLTFIS